MSGCVQNVFYKSKQDSIFSDAVLCAILSKLQCKSLNNPDLLCILNIRNNDSLSERNLLSNTQQSVGTVNFKVHGKTSAHVPAGHKPYIWFAFWQQQLARTKCLAHHCHQ